MTAFGDHLPPIERVEVEAPKLIHRVFLAGPMRGYPRYNFDLFDRAVAHMRSSGLEVVSPHELDLEAGFDPDQPLEPQGFSVAETLARNVTLIASCEAVMFLPGSERSAGCHVERAAAEAFGLQCFQIHDVDFLNPDAEPGDVPMFEELP